MRTFIQVTECPQGHRFDIRRRISSAGFVVATFCAACKKSFLDSVPNVKAPEIRQGRKLRERDIEDRLVERVRELGGEVRKVAWIGRVGAPDRLVMLPERGVVVDPEAHGRYLGPKYPPATIWVELKAPGLAAKFPRNAHERTQHREHERMRRMGQRVELVDSFERIEEVLK